MQNEHMPSEQPITDPRLKVVASFLSKNPDANAVDAAAAAGLTVDQVESTDLWRRLILARASRGGLSATRLGADGGPVTPPLCYTFLSL